MPDQSVCGVSSNQEPTMFEEKITFNVLRSARWRMGLKRAIYFTFDSSVMTALVPVVGQGN